MHNSNLTTLKRTQNGLSLIELLIALSLGLIILLGTSQSLMSMTQSSRAQMEKNKMEQTANIAFAYIGQQFRNSLATPCERIKTVETNGKLTVASLIGEYIDTSMSQDIKDLLEKHGFAIEQSAADAKVTVGGNVTTTDQVISISTGIPVKITGETSIENPTITINGQLPIFEKGGYFSASDTNKPADKILYAITNCEEMDIFRADSAALSSGTTTITPITGTEFNVNYRELESTFIAPLTVSKIYVTTAGGNSGGRLYDQPVFDTTNTNELLDNVELIRILFGVDAQGDDGAVDKYITASQLSTLPDNEQLVTLEMYMLVAADGQQANPILPASYKISVPNTSKPIATNGTIPEETLTFTDRVQRQVFTRTVTLRNNAGL